MASKNKKPFSQSIRMQDSFTVINSLGLRQMFRDHTTVCIAADPSRHCTIWAPVDVTAFFTWIERRTDIYKYSYVVEPVLTDIGSCLRIHAVERSRKTIDL